MNAISVERELAVGSIVRAFAVERGFVIEPLDDGRFTVFVPSVPTPLAGAVYILTPERVHILDVPFTQAVRSISRWGSGSRELVAAMRKG
jgi:uncharacterized membrane protein